MMPSRSAHGQISSSGEVEEVHHRVGDQRAGDDLVRPARRDARAARPARRRVIAQQLGDRVRAAPRRPAPDVPAGPRPTAPRRRSGPASGTSSRSPPRGRAPAAQHRARRRGRCRPGSACAARVRRPGRAPCREVLTGQPAGAERQRLGDVGRLVGARRDLQRAAADVEDRQPARGPAEPPAYGQEGQPGLVLAGQHLDVDPGLLAHVRRAPRRSWSRRAPPRWRSRASPRSPCPRRPSSATPTKSVERLDARRRSPRPTRRGARRAAAAPCASTPAAARHRRARRPRAGARCWSRCRARPVAWRTTLPLAT